MFSQQDFFATDCGGRMNEVHYEFNHFFSNLIIVI